MISAGDALKVMDEMGASLGMEIFAEGLRHMARKLAPGVERDYLEREETVDPELRELFGFGPPLLPTPNPEVKPPPSPSGWLDILIEPVQATFFISLSAWGLREWAPIRKEAPPYVPLLRSLLRDTAETQDRASGLDRRYHALFTDGVLATTWQKTCWQHDRRRKIRVISSPRGAIGIMQVLPSVWRGFYDPNSLCIDVGYNVRAGSEILMHSLKDFALRKAGARPHPDYLAGITYAR